MKGTVQGRKQVGLLRLTVWENNHMLGSLGFLYGILNQLGFGL
jgi:hypothetical protein